MHTPICPQTKTQPTINNQNNEKIRNAEKWPRWSKRKMLISGVLSYLELTKLNYSSSNNNDT